eukprot:1154880-Pelagomonas_calceolata.AAC.10
MAGMMCFRECLGWRGLMRGMAGWVERRAEMVWTFGLLRQRVLWCRMAGTGAKRAEAALSCGRGLLEWAESVRRRVGGEVQAATKLDACVLALVAAAAAALVHEGAHCDLHAVSYFVVLAGCGGGIYV